MNQNIFWRVMKNVKYYSLNKKMIKSDYVFYLFYSNKKNHLGWLIKNRISKDIKLLMKYIDPSYESNYTVRCASEFGNLEVVQFLCSLPHVDASDDKLLSSDAST
jgi:hypothetical protein